MQGAAGPEFQEPPERLPKKEVGVLKGHVGPILGVTLNHNGSYALTCGKDRTVRLWNPVRELCIKTYTGHGQEVRDVACTKDNNRLASCGGDKQVFYWDVSTGRTIRRFRGHDLTPVNSCVFAADDDILVTGGYDQSVRVWDCRSQSIDAIQQITGFGDAVTGVRVHNHQIVAGCVDGTIRTFDVRRGAMTTDDVKQPITAMEISNDGNCVLVGCMEPARLRLLDRGSGEPLASYQGHTNKGSKIPVALTNTDAYVVAGSEDGRVHFWDLVEQEAAAVLDAHKGFAVCGLAYHPEEPRMITAGTDGLAKLWDG